MFEKGFELSYGNSGCGKTTWAMQIAEAVAQMHGKKVRWYIGDGGVQTIAAGGLIEDGIVETFSFNDHDYPLTVLQRITEGYWPEHADDPESPLLAPGEKEFKEVGMWVFEGIYTMSDYVMGSQKGALAERAARGEKIGQDSPISITDPSGLKFGGNAVAHYGVGQRRIIDAIQRSKALPGFVQWTSHEQLSEDRENGNEKIIGPAAVGKALTSKLGLWFGNTLHHTTATKKTKKKDPITLKDVDSYEVERRVYTRDHADPDGTVFIKYLANTRTALLRDDKGKLFNPLKEYYAPPDPLEFYAELEAITAKKRDSRKRA